VNGVSILILEDDRDTIELFAASLSKLGATVRTAMSAEDALAILATWRPNVILCDLHLPGVDGYGFLERVRAVPTLGAIPVIAISASHPELERERSIEAGFSEHLTKPTKLKDVVGAVQRLTA
jgi:CheY-like chemotaxis protein